jgi:hypothetical protein
MVLSKRFVMAKQVCKYIAIIFLIYTAGILGAQTESPAVGFFSGWQLYYSEGEITITQGGVRTIYRAETEKPREILLMPQDMIQTSRGTAEIQLVTGAPSLEKTYTIIKMSENTLLLISRPENREISLELLYGRVRVVTGTAESNIVFRTGASVTTLRNCDTAIDYITRPGITQPVLTLHCFYGQGEIIPRFGQGTEATRFPLKADETFFLEYRIPYSYMERRSLDSQILAYWQSNPFTPGAPLPIPTAVLSMQKNPQTLAGIPAADPPGADNVSQADNSPQTSELPKAKQSKKINVTGLVTGVLLASGGAALLAYSTYGKPEQKFERPLFYSGFAPIGLGTIFIIGSIINPTE